jgi:hypothetical protein
MPGQFPPDQDLPPGAVSVSMVIGPDRTLERGGEALEHLRLAYQAPCDLIVIAVPAGRGRPFLEGLAMSLKASGQFVGEKRAPDDPGA